MLRRLMHPALILLFGLLAGSDALAQTGPAQGFYLRGQLGYAWPSFEDVNTEIRAEEEVLRSITTFLDWEELGGGTRFSGEAGYRISPAFSLGLEFGYQKISIEHSATILFVDSGGLTVRGRVEQTVKPSLFTVLLTPTIQIPSAPGLHLGGQIGLGRGWFKRTESDDLSVSDGSFLVATFTEEYAETALAAGLFIGWDIPMSPDVAFSMRAGYLMSNLSSMDGTVAAEGTTELGAFGGSGPGELTDSAGNRMEVSFSGVNLNVGLLLRFGASR